MNKILFTSQANKRIKCGVREEYCKVNSQKELKQTAYIAGVSVIGIMGILLGTKGRKTPLKPV